MKQTTFICQLPIETQNAIEKELKELNLNNEDIERGMSGRLCDLSDTINITKYLEGQ